MTAPRRTRPLPSKPHRGGALRRRLQSVGRGLGKSGPLSRPAGRIRLTIAAALLIAGLPAARAIVTSDGVGTHVVEPGVPAFGVDLDGVVLVGLEAFPGAVNGTGALISDTHVLTAAHVIEQGTFFFSVRFDLADGPVWIPVKGYAIHPDYDPVTLGFDIGVLELASPAPAGVPRYELHTTHDEIGKSFVIAGYGRTGSGETGATHLDGKKRAGLNRFEASGAMINAAFPDLNPAFPPNALFFDFDSGLPANDLTPLITGTPDLGFGDDEVGVARGDSGGPAFIEGSDGIFRIAGVTAAVRFAADGPLRDADFNDVTGDSSWGELFDSAPVSTNLAFIQDAVAGNLRRQRIFDDGLTHVIDDGLDGGPVIVENSPAPEDAATTVTLENAVVRSLVGDSQGLRVAGSSLVELQAGLIEGTPAARVRDGGRLHVSGGTIRALPSPPNLADTSWAILAIGNAEVRVSGGTIDGVNTGLYAIGNSQVFVTDGSFSGQFAGYADGESTTSIGGGSFEGTDNGFRASGTAAVEILGGSFEGEMDGFKADGEANVEIHGGTFVGEYGVYATDEATVEIIGGEFHGEEDGLNADGTSATAIRGGTFGGTDFSGLFAAEDASVEIFGGAFSGGEVDLSSEGAAVVRIFGYGFNLPFGAVADDAGTISGFYHDGSPFSFSFARQDESVIELVFSRAPVRGSSRLSLSRVSSFGPTEIGSRSRTQRVRVTNAGQWTVRSIAVRSTGRGRRDFAVTQVAKRVLDPGESTAFRVTFRPRAAGARRAEARVGSSARAATLRLHGRSVPKQVAPPSARGGLQRI